MIVSVLRHGEAEAPGPSADSERRLTSRGERQAELAGRRLATGDVKFIAASPLVRAQMSADACARSLGWAARLTDERLRPEADPRSAADLIGELRPDNLLLVSHQPLVGLLFDLLCPDPPTDVSFSVGTLVSIRIERFRPHPTGQFLSVHQPEF